MFDLCPGDGNSVGVRRSKCALGLSAIAAGVCVQLSGCGGGSSGSGGGAGPPPAATYTIGGTVSGLGTGASVTLLDNGGDSTTVSANGSFSFKTAVDAGGSYAVTVGAQPTGETCAVSGGTGTVSAGNVTSVSVACAANKAATYTIGGTVSGLVSGASVVLLDNGGDALTVAANGGFTFATALATGAAYAVTVGTQPAGESCTVDSGSGTVGSANVMSVTVACAASVASSESLLYSFGPTPGPDGNYPNSLIQGKDGNFYGTTDSGGTSHTGTVFEVTPGGVESIVYSFGTSTAVIGYVPGSLLQGSDGNFYGITNSGGTYGVGVLFEIASGTETVLHSFGDVDTSGTIDGAFPYGVIQGSDGNFYGMTSSAGPAFNGVVFKGTPAGTETVIHGFTGEPGDGTGVLSGVIQGSDGALYGVTAGGGTNNTGTVFRITPEGAETLLYSFSASGASDGRSPVGNLVQGSDGNFYGMTTKGGANGTGTVFEITPAGSESVIYSFPAAVNQVNPTPIGTLIQASDGNFYGCTQHGGELNAGTVFKLTPVGVQSVVHTFTAGGTDAAEPVALVQGKDGNIYGVARNGAANGTGGVFKLVL